MTLKNIIPMNRFGVTLTDRQDGKKAFKAILSDYSLPAVLDFDGVNSLGSSFGDEVVYELALRQGGVVDVKNSNAAIRSCIAKVREDAKTAFSVNYIS